MASVKEQLPPLQSLLTRFGKISGMEVNITKTVVIPLWPDTVERYKEQVTGAVPPWAQIQIDTSAIYLGVRIGPGKEEREWETASLRLQAKLRVAVESSGHALCGAYLQYLCPHHPGLYGPGS